jgi:hypothetical protein
MPLTTFLKSSGEKFFPPPPQPRGASETKAITMKPIIKRKLMMALLCFHGSKRPLIHHRIRADALFRRQIPDSVSRR